MMQQKIEKNAYAVGLHNLYAGGLIIISLVILQDFLNIHPLDPAAFITLLLFSIALPFLSGILVLNVVEQRFKYGPVQISIRRIVHVAFFLSILIDLGGIAAAFWHASSIIGIIFICAQFIAFAIYGIYINRLDENASSH